MNPQDTERLGLPSASNSAMWHCPGQRNLIAAANYPENPQDDEDANRGSLIHSAFETDNTLNLDEEMEETYKQGLKFLTDLLLGYSEATGFSSFKEGEREARFWVHDSQTMEPIASAKLDRHYFFGDDAALICDFKSGFVPNLAPSPKSTQLRVQAVALRQEFPHLKRIRVAFCKAKLRAGASDWSDYTEEDLAYAEQWIRYWLWWSKQPDAPLVPGQHCGYCPAKAWCRAAGSYSMLPSVIAASAVPFAPMRVDDVPEAVAMLKEPDLVKIWQVSGVIKKITDAVKTRLKGLPDERLEELGINRGKGAETHSITSITECVAYLQQQGWSMEQILGCMEFSNASLVKVIRSEKGLPSDKAAGAYLKAALAPFITVKTSDQPLKPID